MKALTCEDCGNEFNSPVISLGSKSMTMTRFCPACMEKRGEEEENTRKEKLARDIMGKKRKWREASGIPMRLENKTFENFDASLQQAAFRQAKGWAGGFDLNNRAEYPSLILFSDTPGVGKTHLMVAIANAIIDNWEGDPENSPSRPIRFESGPGLVRRIRATFNLPPDSAHEREEDVYNEMKGVRLLLLDDVGKEKPSASTREIYWFIIDERMKSGLPVVITSRIPLESGQGTLEELMGEDTVDRLYGMSKGTVVRFKGNSYRRRFMSI